MSQENKSKIVYESFACYDKDGMKAFLEQKAAEGWQLVRKVFASEWEFERAEPKELHYAITYLPQFSNEDEFLTAENKGEYLEICAASGWKFVCAHKNMIIFRNEEKNPLPLETDPEAELDVIHKAVLKRTRPSLIVSLVMLAIAIASCFFDGVLSLVYILTFGGLFVLGEYINFYKYLRWRKKALATAALGEFRKTNIPDRVASALSAAVTVVSLAVILFRLVETKNWNELTDIAVILSFSVVYDVFDRLKKRAESVRQRRMLTAVFILICSAMLVVFAFAFV